MFSQSVHDTLVMRDNTLKLVPGLATSWQQVNPTTWRFTLRQGVKFHDGSPFTADDIVFSYERASHPNSQLRQYAIPVGKPRKIDDFTVEFVQDKPNPITLEHATTIYIMSKAWAIKNKVERPLDFKSKEETFASATPTAPARGSWYRASRASRPCSGATRIGGASKTAALRETSPKWSTRKSAPMPRALPRCCRVRLISSSIRRRRMSAESKRTREPRSARARKPRRLLRIRSNPRRAAVLKRQGQESVQGRSRAPGRLSRDRYRGDQVADHARLGAAHRRHHAVDHCIEPRR